MNEQVVNEQVNQVKQSFDSTLNSAMQAVWQDGFKAGSGGAPDSSPFTQEQMDAAVKAAVEPVQQKLAETEKSLAEVQKQWDAAKSENDIENSSIKSVQDAITKGEESLAAAKQQLANFRVPVTQPPTEPIPGGANGDLPAQDPGNIPTDDQNPTVPADGESVVAKNSRSRR